MNKLLKIIETKLNMLPLKWGNKNRANLNDILDNLQLPHSYSVNINNINLVSQAISQDCDLFLIANNKVFTSKGYVCTVNEFSKLTFLALLIRERSINSLIQYNVYK